MVMVENYKAGKKGCKIHGENQDIKKAIPKSQILKNIMASTVVAPNSIWPRAGAQLEQNKGNVMRWACN
jgi:hypothetical protein